jgi:hypothetical protein
MIDRACSATFAHRHQHHHAFFRCHARCNCFETKTTMEAPRRRWMPTTSRGYLYYVYSMDDSAPFLVQEALAHTHESAHYSRRSDTPSRTHTIRSDARRTRLVHRYMICLLLCYYDACMQYMGYTRAILTRTKNAKKKCHCIRSCFILQVG